MRCAVVDPNTGAVVNIIVADPEKDSIPGYLLVAVPEGSAVDQRWEYRRGRFVPTADLTAEMTLQRYEWDETEGQFKPNAELRAELEAIEHKWYESRKL